MVTYRPGRPPNHKYFDFTDFSLDNKLVNNNQKGFSTFEFIVSIVIVAAIIAAGIYVWKSHSKGTDNSTVTSNQSQTSQSKTGIVIPVPIETNASTNCYSLNIPQKDSSGTSDIDGSTCRIDVGFENGNLELDGGLSNTSLTLSAILEHYKSQANIALEGHARSIKQITVNGEHGVCLTDIFTGSASAYDVLPANTTITCSFITSKAYSLQDYETPPKTFTSNSFDLTLELYTTNQASSSAIADSIINSIHWE